MQHWHQRSSAGSQIIVFQSLQILCAERKKTSWTVQFVSTFCTTCVLDWLATSVPGRNSLSPPDLQKKVEGSLQVKKLSWLIRRHWQNAWKYYVFQQRITISASLRLDFAHGWKSNWPRRNLPKLIWKSLGVQGPGNHQLIKSMLTKSMPAHSAERLSGKQKLTSKISCQESREPSKSSKNNKWWFQAIGRLNFGS